MAKKKLTKIGRYKILGELGRGAMGIVYGAEDPALDRAVALKTIILSDEVEGRKEFHKRFFLEAKAAGKLTHPNIITVYDFGEEGDLAYMAMELLKESSSAPRCCRAPSPSSKRSISRSRWPTASPMRTSAASSIATSSRATSC